uniref:Uncharacterized protein n=1 Tax=Brassica oleracea var. oleracea TaxID=109376 RepID=A0A0D3ATN8_BRAOL
MRDVGMIPSSNNQRLQNLVESQLEITKNRKLPNCLSPRTPYILAPRDGFTQIAKDAVGQGLDHEVDLANHREESVPFNVHEATSILEFSSSQMFSMLFRDSLGKTETERNALVATERVESWLELGRYRPNCVGARSLRSDRAWLELGRYVATELCNRFAALPFSAINLGVFCGFFGEHVLPFRKVFGKRVLTEKSQARFVALPVGEKLWLGFFDFFLGTMAFAEQKEFYSEFAYERYNKVEASAMRAVGVIPISNNLRLQNLVESQLEITKNGKLPNCSK